MFRFRSFRAWAVARALEGSRCSTETIRRTFEKPADIFSFFFSRAVSLLTVRLRFDENEKSNKQTNNGVHRAPERSTSIMGVARATLPPRVERAGSRFPYLFEITISRSSGRRLKRPPPVPLPAAVGRSCYDV